MICHGHAGAWDYTPAQAEAFVMLAEKRLKKERARQLAVHAMAVRGEAKEINRKIRTDWAD